MANSNQLAQLKDIHLPEPIGWWPLALGWYILIGLLLIALLGSLVWIYRYYQQGRAKRQALRMLKDYVQRYQQDNNHQLMSARLSELLRRVALAYFPRSQVASLEGEAWIAFLNQ
jgi:type II secretory pathway pseudopilin PulG